MKRQRHVETFEVIVEREGDGQYHIFCPALRGCHAYGATKKEAMDKIQQAIEIWLENARDAGTPIPERRTVTVDVDNQ